MIIRLEQALPGYWTHLIDIPVDDFSENEVSELLNTLSKQFLDSTKVVLSNPEADFSVIVCPENGPIRLRYLQADETTHLYGECSYGARGTNSSDS